MSEWGTDDLTRFLDMARGNQQANRINFVRAYSTLTRIDAALSEAGKNLINSTPIMAGVLLHRCQYAFKTAAGMALAGQVVETFVMLRSVIECAGYALVIFEKPALEDVFVNRHVSEADKKVQKAAFKVSEVRACIGRYDGRLAELFDTFYERSIDFGGHPNPHATFSALQMEEKDGSTGITTLAITADPKAIAHALKSLAQAGLMALYIFQHIFAAKFELLGIRAEIDDLRKNAGL